MKLINLSSYLDFQPKDEFMNQTNPPIKIKQLFTKIM